jgi:hypothetical protein
MTYDKRMMIDYCRRMMESLRRTTNRQLSPNDGKLTMYNEQTTVAEWWKACNVRQTDDDRRLSPNDGKLTTYNEQTTVAEWWKAYDVRWTDDDRRLSLNEEKLTPYNEQTMTDDCRRMMESLRRTTNRQWQMTVAERRKAYDVQRTDDDWRLSPNDGKPTTYNKQTRTDDCRWMMAKAKIKLFYCLF